MPLTSQVKAAGRPGRELPGQHGRGSAGPARPRQSWAERRWGRLARGIPGRARGQLSATSPAAGPAGRPRYLLQQRPEAQLVRAAALRPLADVGRRHQPLAGTEVLRVHGRGAVARAGAPAPGSSGSSRRSPLGTVLDAEPPSEPPATRSVRAGDGQGAPLRMREGVRPARRRAGGRPLRGDLRPAQPTGDCGPRVERWAAPC